MSDPKLNPKRLSYVCDALAGISALLILMAAAGASSRFTAPGAFLFDRFHLAALYLPFLTFLTGLLIRSGRLPRRTMVLLWVSPVPFLTTAVLLQTASGNTDVMISRLLLDGLGRIPSVLLCSMALALEVVAMVKIAGRFSRPEDILVPMADLKARAVMVLAFLGLQETREEGEAAGGDEPTLEDRPPMAFPDFPDAPEPIAEAVEPDIPAAPEKPRSPASPASDPVVSDLIRRALKPTSAPTPTPAPARPAAAALSEDAPRHSAFPAPPDVTPAPADIRDYFKKPADESIAEVLMGSVVPAPAGDEDSPPRIPDEPVPLDPAFAFLAGEDVVEQDEAPVERIDSVEEADDPVELFPSAVPDEPQVSDLAELTGQLPEEDRDIADISDKLDPQGSSPVGIIVETKSRPRSRKRRR